MSTSFQFRARVHGKSFRLTYTETRIRSRSHATI